jgi:hypothetical protein
MGAHRGPSFDRPAAVLHTADIFSERLQCQFMTAVVRWNFPFGMSIQIFKKKKNRALIVSLMSIIQRIVLQTHAASRNADPKEMSVEW